MSGRDELTRVDAARDALADLETHILQRAALAHLRRAVQSSLLRVRLSGSRGSQHQLCTVICERRSLLRIAVSDLRDWPAGTESIWNIIPQYAVNKSQCSAHSGNRVSTRLQFIFPVSLLPVSRIPIIYRISREVSRGAGLHRESSLRAQWFLKAGDFTIWLRSGDHVRNPGFVKNSGSL
jgi:hypothetical protein